MRKRQSRPHRAGHYKSTLIQLSVFLIVVSFVATGYRQDVQATPIPVDPLIATQLASDLAASAGLPVSSKLSLRAADLAAKEETVKPVLVDEVEIAPVAALEPRQAPVERLATIAPIAEDYTRPAFAVDPSGNRYAPGNCTWYVYERRLQLGRPIGSFWGNAGQWIASALAANRQVTYLPSVGAVLVDQAGYYGHVAIVEEVYADGSIRISEMNSAWGGGGFNIVSGRTLTRLESLLYTYVE